MKFDFTLENFMDKVSEKPIKIESTNTYGEIGLKIEITITDANLEFITGCDRYKLTINNNIKVIFDEWNICEEDNCQNILALNRSSEEFIYINLPIGDS